MQMVGWIRLHGKGLVSVFRDMNCHVSTFHNNDNNHLSFHQPFNSLGHRRDFSLETRVWLDGLNQMGGLEQRTTFLDIFNNSPFNR